MNEDALNTSMRKFLKRVGVTSQREIETALREADEAGTLNSDRLEVKVTLTVPAVGLQHDVDGELVIGNE